MRLTIEVWRQSGPTESGRWERHELEDLTPSESLLDVIDLLNDRIVAAGGEPVAYESDCREGILRGLRRPGQRGPPRAGTADAVVPPASARLRRRHPVVVMTD